MCATPRMAPPLGRQLLLCAIAAEGEEDGADDFDGEEREGKGTGWPERGGRVETWPGGASPPEEGGGGRRFDWPR
jgi:hypothetical protein